ncbi:MAG: LysR family transcriptional regulator [Proteobacteria bacterium]|nr:LysR family transcriptional regulator [Pseudomonadota bacterium]
MNITLRQLRAFVTVAQLGSFTQAAADLHITQSTLSGLIKELEQALGVQIVHRTTRKVELSGVGKAFLPLTARILQDLDEALRAITDLKALKSGVVRIAAPQLMACTLLADVVGSFTKQHPGIDVHLSDCKVDEVLPKVHSGEVDFGIGPERPASQDIAAQPLFDMPFVAVLAQGHPLTRFKRLTWTQFLQHPVISLEGAYTQLLRRDLLAASDQLTLAPAKEVAFMTTALSLVSAGIGVTVCLPYARSLVNLYGLETRPLGTPIVRRKFYLLARQDRVIPPAARAFADYLLTYVTQRKWGSMEE